MPELKRTAREAELAAKAAKYLAGGTLGNLADDVVLQSGRGSRIRDVSGNEYIDYLSGNPIATVAGLATVRILKRPGTFERMHAIGNQLKAALQRICDDARVPARVVGEGVLFDVFFTDGEITDYRSTLRADKEKLGRFVRLLRQHGVFRGFSKFYLSIVHDQRDVDETVRAFAAAIDGVRPSHS